MAGLKFLIGFIIVVIIFIYAWPLLLILAGLAVLGIIIASIFTNYIGG